MARVFIETTIPSYYFETRTDRRSRDWHEQTRLWWDAYRARYDLVSSELVVAEFSDAPPEKSSRAGEFFAQLAMLAPPPGFDDVVGEYIAQKLMPADAVGDAAHLAMASMHGVEFILTWNCRHLANANKQRHIRIVNARLGLATPTIATPFELVPE